MAGDDELISVSHGPGFQTWRMNFAPVNALDPRLLSALSTSLDAASRDKTVAAIVLTSELRVFSAGADAAWMNEIVQAQGLDGLIEQFNETMDRFREFCLGMRRSPLLFIAVLNGHTLAGGLELAAACDLRFCTDHPKVQLGVPEMDLFGAMPTGGGGVQFLTRLLRPSRALDFVLDAKPVSPTRALEMGLVDRIIASTDLLHESEKFAGDVARKAGRVGVSAAKRAIFTGAELPLYEAMDLDRSLHWDAMRRGNFLPGVEAFMAKFGRPG